MRLFDNRPLLITLVVAVVLIGLIILVPGGSPGVVGDAGGTATSGIQGFFDQVFGAVGDFFSGIFTPSDLEAENAALREQVLALEQQLAQMQDYEQENKRLSQLLNYAKENPQYEYITARVILKDPGYWFDVFTINVGKNKGIAVNDAVVTADGLVGRVTEVGATWSTVTAIIDSRSAVSCIVERTRDNGIVNGGLQIGDEAGLCEISFLPVESDIIVGDAVITSGLGGIYPKGIRIGVVKEIMAATSQSAKKVVVQPSVNLQHLDEVMIVHEREAAE